MANLQSTVNEKYRRELNKIKLPKCSWKLQIFHRSLFLCPRRPLWWFYVDVFVRLLWNLLFISRIVHNTCYYPLLVCI